MISGIIFPVTGHEHFSAGLLDEDSSSEESPHDSAHEYFPSAAKVTVNSKYGT